MSKIKQHNVQKYPSIIDLTDDQKTLTQNEDEKIEVDDNTNDLLDDSEDIFILPKHQNSKDIEPDSTTQRAKILEPPPDKFDDKGPQNIFPKVKRSIPDQTKKQSTTPTSTSVVTPINLDLENIPQTSNSLNMPPPNTKLLKELPSETFDFDNSCLPVYRSKYFSPKEPLKLSYLTKMKQKQIKARTIPPKPNARSSTVANHYSFSPANLREKISTPKSLQ